jgi:hypothetical protein
MRSTFFLKKATKTKHVRTDPLDGFHTTGAREALGAPDLLEVVFKIDFV